MMKTNEHVVVVVLQFTSSVVVSYTYCSANRVLIFHYCDCVTFGSLLSQIRLSSATFVRPTQGIETSGKYYSSPFCTLAILWPPCKILRRSFEGNLSAGGVKGKRGSKIERCHVRVSHLLTSFLFSFNYYNALLAVCTPIATGLWKQPQCWV